ncbi:hypothetical protein SEA_WEASELS2_191 [Rhodococcus phage Weasels2]|uniref:Uncharacterized protein n=1 Tax=Rhodococcus phage Weasels2 TaxID=1897437 RepID=A0A1I9SAG3_9CAUD|nr:hypothetical protein FDH04_gp225 [Rhodococcus phage Weasels2]AOZ63769.1 hypothetical protein SEA_WEASELS2_191 [Rhodococcus phage Weasels2]
MARRRKFVIIRDKINEVKITKVWPWLLLGLLVIIAGVFLAETVHGLLCLLIFVGLGILIFSPMELNLTDDAIKYRWKTKVGLIGRKSYDPRVDIKSKWIDSNDIYYDAFLDYYAVCDNPNVGLGKWMDLFNGLNTEMKEIDDRVKAQSIITPKRDYVKELQNVKEADETVRSWLSQASNDV